MFWCFFCSKLIDLQRIVSINKHPTSKVTSTTPKGLILFQIFFARMSQRQSKNTKNEYITINTCHAKKLKEKLNI